MSLSSETATTVTEGSDQRIYPNGGDSRIAASHHATAIGSVTGDVTINKQETIADAIAKVESRKLAAALKVFRDYDEETQVTLLERIRLDTATALVTELAATSSRHCGALMNQLVSERAAQIVAGLTPSAAAQVLSWATLEHAAADLDPLMTERPRLVAEVLAELTTTRTGAGPLAGPGSSAELLARIAPRLDARQDLLAELPVSEGSARLLLELPPKDRAKAVLRRPDEEGARLMDRIAELSSPSVSQLLTDLGAGSAAPLIRLMERRLAAAALAAMPAARAAEFLRGLITGPAAEILTLLAPEQRTAALAEMADADAAAVLLGTTNAEAARHLRAIHPRRALDVLRAMRSVSKSVVDDPTEPVLAALRPLPLADVLAMALPRDRDRPPLPSGRRTLRGTRREALMVFLAVLAHGIGQALQRDDTSSALRSAVRDEWRSAVWLWSTTRSFAQPEAPAGENTATASVTGAHASDARRYRAQRNLAALVATAFGTALVTLLVATLVSGEQSPTQSTASASTPPPSNPAEITPPMASDAPVEAIDRLLEYDNRWRDVCPVSASTVYRDRLRLYCSFGPPRGQKVDRWLLWYPSPAAADSGSPPNLSDVHSVSPSRRWTDGEGRTGIYYTYALEEKNSSAVWLCEDGGQIALQLVAQPGPVGLERLSDILRQRGYLLV
ncbi:hypothetical protein [Micromonospora tulbaghiae]|uniref:hypothetical protein n=1 Tax=Micromonospora tulbaghiae TaxID=479978 RepID=UPI0033C44853